MGLRKTSTNIALPDENVENENREVPRDFTQLKFQILSLEPSERRWAARDLGNHPEGVPILLETLETETVVPVLDAIFTSLQKHPTHECVNGLIRFLSSEDASVRNNAIEVLQSMPNALETHILSLLNHPDSDVRIFAIDILQQLVHQNAPEWLKSVLLDETHVNVVATAVDRIVEIGDSSILPTLERVAQRFAQHDYIQFAVNTAIERIKEDTYA
ncbi:HEAT repeat domain-containing protein [Opacimonas viscosa]|uniref:HEAT repeat domain-containing protein n=1 Tax=Opacimonas viscosa TaxID=2961944 RepID=A0AA41X4Q5_9ALTE|nr:HEAT repeat domain-containing protein [Opacimonas viscosa]MCP3429441.1 HEAT repeat domain-containing protein [Opacimonas viscosa]